MRTIVVMFTDLAESTKLYLELGPRRAAALREEHFAVLSDLTRAHHGTLVKTLGDGVMAVFPSVSDTLDAAVGMQRAAFGGKTPLRVGISAGDAELDGDGDWHGRSVVEAFRICSSAAAGQILLSDTALRLAPANQHRTRRLEPVDLRGLDRVELHELAWDPQQAPLRLVIADDAALVREGLARLLDASPGLEVVGTASDGTSLLAEVRRHRPHLVITDMRMPPQGEYAGLAVLRAIKRQHPGIAVVLLSARVEPHVAADLLEGSEGGVGYLHKDRVGDVQDFISALRMVAGGACVLDHDLGSAPDRPRSALRRA
jgi:CheY-like chemotaxis protein